MVLESVFRRVLNSITDKSNQTPLLFQDDKLYLLDDVKRDKCTLIKEFYYRKNYYLYEVHDLFSLCNIKNIKYRAEISKQYNTYNYYKFIKQLKDRQNNVRWVKTKNFVTISKQQMVSLTKHARPCKLFAIFINITHFYFKFFKFNTNLFNLILFNLIVAWRLGNTNNFLNLKGISKNILDFLLHHVKDNTFNLCKGANDLDSRNG
uniref:Membrane protein n=1 Tax=Dikerogammarus haemobaphes virus 1 TaxID=2704946 RepID=A0A6G9HDI0_9VIRU|nr:membrane protein [Dikerogammarus haemobaphes virus 1]